MEHRKGFKCRNSKSKIVKMALSKPLPDQSNTYNSVYNITLDMSNWSQTTIQVVAPINGAMVVYASNDDGSLQSVRQGDASLALNFMPIQVTNLATGVAASSISAAGLYRATVDAQFLRLQGSPASAGTNVYKLLLFNSKVD